MVLLLFLWPTTGHADGGRWIVTVHGHDLIGLLFGEAKRHSWWIHRLDDGLRGAPPGWDRHYLIEAPSISAWADSLRAMGASVEADAWYEPLCVGAPERSRARASSLPDDPELLAGRQWGLWSGSSDTALARGLDVRAPEAWALVSGRAGVSCAVLDTGVDPHHPDLQADESGGSRLVALSALAGAEGDVADSLGHGTMVCGVLGALTGNHLGIAGMAGGTERVLSIKVTAGHGQAARGTDLARGLVMAVDLGARVVNISFAGTGTSDALRSALAWAVAQGCVVVCGAGNSADERPQYPAAYADLGICVAVTAADRDGSLPLFDTRGAWIDGSAPGVDILSTWPEYANAYGSDLRDEAMSSGTSFAAPLVAGIAELALSADSTLAGGDFRELFRRTSRDMRPAADTPFADADALVGGLLPPHQLQHGDAAAERWWEAGEETLRVRRSTYWFQAGDIDGDYVARRFEVRASPRSPGGLDGAVTWVRPTGWGGWRPGRVHDGEESWGEVTPEGDLRTCVYRIDTPAIGWVPRPPEDVVLAWTRWGVAHVSARGAAGSGTRLQLIGSSPARGAVRFAVSGPTDAREIAIFDVRGRLVRRLSLEHPSPGNATALWTGDDEAGRMSPAGLYFACLRGAAVQRFVRLP